MFLRASIQGYRKYKDWYRNTRSSLINKFSSDYKMVAGLIASTSPRRDVQRNIRIAIAIYKEFNSNRKQLLNEMVNNRKQFCKRFELMNAHYNNVKTTLTHNYNKPLELSGNKVNAFYNNMIGNYDFVTIDIWMLRILGLTKEAITSKKEYQNLSNIISEVAKEQNLLPAELQSILWIKYKQEIGQVQIRNNKKQLKKFQPIDFKTFIEKFA